MIQAYELESFGSPTLLSSNKKRQSACFLDLLVKGGWEKIATYILPNGFMVKQAPLAQKVNVPQSSSLSKVSRAFADISF